ncbi:MAG TPA: NUDIX hydrolase [Syntrophorhabdales bacterium]|nr:NUDIX hydrolase [Syntrophorhabdales bacterium]
MIYAAGGIVWKDTPEGRKLAVIHRSRYDDWSLPKGKLKGDETWEEAAVREVKEETGCEVRITGFAGSTSYQAKGKPKLVLYFAMEAVNECLFTDTSEVKEVLWLSPEEALDKLDYEVERDLLSKSFAPTP